MMKLRNSLLAVFLMLTWSITATAETACAAGEFLNLADENCYTCPHGYSHDFILPADVPGVCYKLPVKSNGIMGSCGAQNWVRTCAVSNPFGPGCWIYGGYWNKTGCASNGTFQVQSGNTFYNCGSGNLPGSSHDILVPFNQSGICFKFSSRSNITATPVPPVTAGNSCVGLFQGNCADGLICDGGTHLCRNDPPTLGQACGLSVPCDDQYTCFAGTCKEKGTSTQQCDFLVGDSSCVDPLVCDIRGECRADPPNNSGEFCGLLEPCAGQLACFNGRCQERGDSTDSCDPLVSNSCANNLECVSDTFGITWECRNKPPKLGEICGLGDTCADGLMCDALLTGGRCELPKQAKEACVGTGQGNCRAGLVCDDGLLGNGQCRHPVPWKGERCGLGITCTQDASLGGPLACSATIGGKCETPKGAGESCQGLGQGNCSNGLLCSLTYDLGGVTEFNLANFDLAKLGPRCTPAPQPGIEQPVPAEVCNAWFHPVPWVEAKILGLAVSRGSSVSLSGGVAGTLEHGAVYGPSGQFGCYLTTCVGADWPAASVSACLGYEGQFPTDGEQEVQAVVGYSFAAPSKFGISAAAIDQVDANGLQLDGVSACVDAGIGLGTITGGIYQCNTQVTIATWDTNGDNLSDAQAASLNLAPDAPGGDTDGDGTSDVDELGADLDNPIDSDGDGVIDALEPLGPSAFANIAAGLPLPNGSTATIVVDIAQNLSGVRSAPVFGAPAGIQFPYGIFEFSTSSGPGGSQLVTLTLSEDLPATATIFRVNVNGDFIELARNLWEMTGSNKLTLTLTDGDPTTDLDQIVNSEITFAFAIGKRDIDDDGILDNVDNCRYTVNPGQEDLDADGIGDICADDLDNDLILNAVDICPVTPDPNQEDLDADGIGDACDSDDDNDGVDDSLDNCPVVVNAGQSDIDADDLGDACDADMDGDRFLNGIDNCPGNFNADQIDVDLDGIGNVCDPDNDNDSVLNALDNCPFTHNPDQSDLEGDGIGDACDPDDDGDAVADGEDNCPLVANDQSDIDGDALGDACDDDRDGDSLLNLVDNCPANANIDQSDIDNDGIGDACDSDIDGDQLGNNADNCPAVSNADQRDLDGDEIGDACDSDKDDDGVENSIDNCPANANTNQSDGDGDGLGDACDPDADNDLINDVSDNCPVDANPDQLNSDDDIFGDACDEDDDNDGLPDTADNCPVNDNPLQEDGDGDGEGDVCDLDLDSDGVLNDVDNCAVDANPDQANNDHDAFGDVCDPDDDNDGVEDIVDGCPFEDASGFDVDNDGCIDSHATLKEMIEALVLEGVISQEMQNSLLSTVSNAEKSVSKDNVCAAVNQLNALVNHVNAQIGNKISVTAAFKVTNYAGSINLYLQSKLPDGDSC